MSEPGDGLCEEGLWQLVESGRYTADLDTWSGLAEQTGGPVLDLGCGIGRVSHHLNRLGVTTVGLDLNPDLIEDFDRTRPTGSPAGMVGDAAALGGSALLADGGLFRLAVAPQQLVQILGGHEARMRLLRALPGLLEPDGLAAFAICEDLPEVDIRYPGVPPDLSEIGDWVHSSLPVAIDAGPGSVTALRLRQSLGPDGTSTRENDRVNLDRLDRSTFEAELKAAGMRPCGCGLIEQTDRHMGSTLILARPPLS